MTVDPPPCNIPGAAFDFEEGFGERRSRPEASALGIAARFQTIVRIRIHTTADLRLRNAFRIEIVFRIDFIVCVICFLIALSLLELPFDKPVRLPWAGARVCLKTNAFFISQSVARSVFQMRYPMDPLLMCNCPPEGWRVLRTAG